MQIQPNRKATAKLTPPPPPPPPAKQANSPSGQKAVNTGPLEAKPEALKGSSTTSRLVLPGTEQAADVTGKALKGAQEGLAALAGQGVRCWKRAFDKASRRLTVS
ncbi:MAG: hypothetical protein VKP62_16960 [Candidatus Sericytochromatia bacterium]|nr:hypothetical protein [Candidatus Sericytochromatia bacterium]